MNGHPHPINGCMHAFSHGDSSALITLLDGGPLQVNFSNGLTNEKSSNITILSEKMA